MKKSVLGMGVFVCGAFLILALGFTASQAKTIPPAVKVLSIPGPAFEMPGNDVGYINNGALWMTKDAQYVRAPLVLPNGSVITKVELYGKDAHSSLGLRLWIHAFNNTNTKSFTMCYVESTGSGTTYRSFGTTNIKPSIIDNLNNFYFLNLHIPDKGDSKFVVLGVKVYYTGTW